MLLQGQGKQDVQAFSFGIGRTSNLESFTCSLDLKVRQHTTSTVKKRNSEVRQHLRMTSLSCEIGQSVSRSGGKLSHRKGPTKMQQGLNAGNVHSIIIIIIIHVYTGDLPATTVDVMGGPVIIKY